MTKFINLLPKKRMTMSDLPEDLVVEILSRVPMTSLRSMRSTCKQWNALSRNWIIGKIEEAKKNQFLGFMTNNLMICSVRIDLQGINNNDGDVDLSIKHVLKEFEVYNAYHCDGLLLLCILNHSPCLVVWNPYLGQTRFIQPIAWSDDEFALGYDNNRNHKILHVIDSDQYENKGFNIYEFSSDSWRVLDLTPDVKIDMSQNVTLKGNAYFYAEEKEENQEIYIKKHFLLCFDFTSERFGPRLSLPYHCYSGGNVALSCVRDKQLAVLIYQDYREEIWVTNKIDYNEVLWTKWVQVDTQRLSDFPINLGVFFIDVVEEKKVAVVFNHAMKNNMCFNQIAHIIGQNEYLKSINLGDSELSILPELYGYHPSLVDIQ